MNGLYLALPSYNGSRTNTHAILCAAARPAPFAGVRPDDVGSSLMANNFNEMWARALNARAQGFTHFVMLHSDVMPHSGTWVGEMHAIMERVGASVLSVVLPLKDHQGLTSTALDRANVWNPKRLTMKEIYGENQPSTFTHDRLLVNTGLMMVDFRDPWVEQAYFTIRDEIRQKPDGQFYAAAESEDWFFSRKARELGAKLFATREIAASHFGGSNFDNTSAWGTMDTDPGCDRQEPPRAAQTSTEATGQA
jgi:GT2 family glycosyltransferase